MRYLLSLLLLAQATLLAQINEDWNPPVGIPRPAFGITNSVDMYLPAHGITYTFTDGRGTIVYPVSSGGIPYTHYVDKVTGTDTGRPYGTEAAPRATWPAIVDPGSVVLVKGYGQANYYSFNNSGPGSKMAIQGAGTETRPIFLRSTDTNSASMAWINRSEFTPNGNYLIVEHMGFYMCKADGRPSLKGAPISRQVIRYCIALGDGANGGPSSAFGMSGDSLTYYTEYGLVFGCNVSYYGNWAGTVESDNLAVVFGTYSYNMWMLDNEVHHMGGDAIRVGKDDSSAAVLPECEFHYVGRNHFHHNRENGLDIKKADKVVVSENEMHDFAVSGTSAGTALAIHYYPRDVYILNNLIYNAPRLIGSTSSADYDVNIIGNIFYGATEYALYPDRGGGTYRIYNNTILDSAAGIIANDNSANHTIISKNNIIVNMTGNYLHMSSAYTPLADYSHLLIWETGGGSTPILWGNDGTFNTVADWIAGTTEGDNSISSDPELDASYMISATSPARNAGMDWSALNTTFQGIFGTEVTLMKDRNGNTRGGDGTFDMGALEYDSNPPGVTGLIISGGIISGATLQ